MDALIRKLQAARAGSDELDFEIAEELDRRGIKYATTIEGRAPQWSQSIDAALTLGPPGAYALLLEALAMAARYFVHFHDPNGHIMKKLPTLICLAALRAREEEGRR